MGKPIIGGKRLGPGSNGSAAAPRSKNAIESARRRGRKSGKRTNGNSYSKHKHEPGQAALCLPESRQRLRLYDKEMARDIIPTLAHYEWGTPFCFLCKDAYPCSQAANLHKREKPRVGVS